MRVSPVLIIMAFIASSALHQSLFKVEEGQRAVILKLDRPERIVEPGWQFKVPMLERSIAINLQQEIPHWQTLSVDDLNRSLELLAYKKETQRRERERQ